MKKTIIETPDGFVALCWTGLGLFSLKLPEPTLPDAEMEIGPDFDFLKKTAKHRSESSDEKINIKLLEGELKDYFSGRAVKLNFPVDWSYYTDFQKRVLQVVYNIPWGQVVSYGQVAASIGKPRASRAVGGAVGSNRVLLVVPCHRVIAQNGSLGGFGEGLGCKRNLLRLEGVHI